MLWQLSLVHPLVVEALASQKEAGGDDNEDDGPYFFSRTAPRRAGLLPLRKASS